MNLHMFNEVTVTILKFKYYPALKSLTFDEIVRELKPRLDFHVHKHSGKLPGYDDDDIRQELMIELWEKYPQRPADMELLDYRFTRWCETVFNRRIIDLHRNQLYIRRQGYGGPRIVEGYRDGLARSFFTDTIEDVVDEVGHIRFKVEEVAETVEECS